MNESDDTGDTTLGDIVEGVEEEAKALIPPAYAKLKEIRTRKDLTARKSPFLREQIVGLDGKERELKLRYYQVQGVLHLLAMPRFLLGDDTGLGKCTTATTRVLTDHGLVQMGSLGPWETMEPDTFAPVSAKVWTGWEWAPIKQFYYGGVKPTLKFTTQRGYEITATKVHPLWCRQGGGSEGFNQARDLGVGAFLALERKPVAFPENEPALPVSRLGINGKLAPDYRLPTHLGTDLAAFLGYLVAERDRSSVSVGTNLESQNHIGQLVEALFGGEGTRGLVNNDRVIYIQSTCIQYYLEGLGFLSSQRTVPWPIFHGTKESVASFLRAFFDSKGSVGDGVVEVTSHSGQLLREVQVLLLRFGIVCSRASKTVTSMGYDHTYWCLTLCGDAVREFKGHIGFGATSKRIALDTVLEREDANANLDVVPYAVDLVGALRADILRAVSTGSKLGPKDSGLARFGVSFEKTLNDINDGGHSPTYNFLVKLLTLAEMTGADKGPAYHSVCNVVDNHFFYDPIVSITEGSEPVMDIEVDHPRHSFVGSGFVNHNTLQAIATVCYLWEKDPSLKVVVLTTKSALEQWGTEFEKFTHGVKSFICRGTPAQRKKVRAAFTSYSGPSVIVMGYGTAKQDFGEIQDWEGYVFITDEATAYKNPKTQTHKVCKHLSSKASRTWALTATLIKNSLHEGWGIYAVVVPGLFGSENAFLNEFCIVRMMPIPGSRRQIPTIVGYRQRDITAFRERIDPYFLGRPKFEVASDLPPLVTRHVKVDLNPEQQTKYDEALTGLLEIGTTANPQVIAALVGKTEEEMVGPEEKEVSPLTAVTYCQLIVDHLALIGCDGDSAKLDALTEILSEGEFADEKVIVYTRFRKMVDIIMPALKAAKIPAVRITGAENEKGRKAAQDAFQDPNGKTRVVCITSAAAEAINLQSAKAIIFYDSPWSAGEYLQILGRMIRLGSIHDRCFALHLCARGTIDDRVTQVLAKKMGLVESVLGKRLKGEDTDVVVDVENDLSELFAALVSDAKGRGSK